MKLYSFLSNKADGEELTVWDKAYDMETYFYGGEDENDTWQSAMVRLAKVLDVVAYSSAGVTVNLSDAIGKRLDKLKEAELFHSYDMDDIMNDMENILAGNVSEEWFESFVNCMSE